MRKLYIALVYTLVVGGCGAVDRGCANLSGDPTEVCWGGVTYLQFTSGSTVKVDSDGKPVTCKK